MRSKIAVVLGLVLAGCGKSDSTPNQPETQQYGEVDTVPQAFVGEWRYVGEQCEKDSEETPSKAKRNVTVSFRPDFRYEMYVEGWRSVGSFRIDRFKNSPDRIQLLETLYEFELANDRLENWSEGEAVYLCGNIFERIRN